jgi:segregation and condensation protein B
LFGDVGEDAADENVMYRDFFLSGRDGASPDDQGNLDGEEEEGEEKEGEEEKEDDEEGDEEEEEEEGDEEEGEDDDEEEVDQDEIGNIKAKKTAKGNKVSKKDLFDGAEDEDSSSDQVGSFYRF